jgi:drug/metabolite transporter (DMT)-like permease
MGSLWMLFASMAFAAMGVFAKLGAGHFSSLELVFYRSLFGVISLGGLARLRGWTLGSPHWRLHLTRGGFGVVSLGLYFHCIGRIPLATAVTLNYTSPLFLALITTVFMAEPLHWPLAAAATVSFLGVLLLLEPTLDRDQWIDGTLGLASGLLAAIAYASVKRLGASGEPSWRVVFHFTLLSTVVAGIGMALTEVHVVDAGNAWIILGIGLTATLGQFAMTRAYHTGDTLVVGALSFATVLFSALLGLGLWGETLRPGAWVGMALIVAGGLLSLRAMPSAGASARRATPGNTGEVSSDTRATRDKARP